MSINDRLDVIDTYKRNVPDELLHHHGKPYMRAYIKSYIVDFYQRETEIAAERALIWEQKNRKEKQK
jgi:hypothetical protein